MPLVSIIMPSYKASTSLLQAVKSVVEQDFQDWELLVINDACPNQSYKTIQQLSSQDERIMILHNDSNKGVAYTRNVGIKQARGKYIAFLDADDLWLPTKLSEQIKLLNSTADIVYAYYYRQTTTGKKLVKTPVKTCFKAMLKSNYIGNLTGIYNAKKLGKQYQKSIGHEDYLMWLELLQKTKVAVAVEKPLAIYNVAEGSISANKLKTISWQWYILRRELSLNTIVAAYYLSWYSIMAIYKRL